MWKRQINSSFPFMFPQLSRITWQNRECPVVKSMREYTIYISPLDRAYKCEQEGLGELCALCRKPFSSAKNWLRTGQQRSGGWAYAAYERFGPGTSAGKAIDTKSWPQFVQIALSPRRQCRAKSADKMLSCLCMSRIRPAAHLPLILHHLVFESVFLCWFSPIAFIPSIPAPHWIELSLYTCRIYTNKYCHSLHCLLDKVWHFQSRLKSVYTMSDFAAIVSDKSCYIVHSDRR